MSTFAKILVSLAVSGSIYIILTIIFNTIEDIRWNKAHPFPRMKLAKGKTKLLHMQTVRTPAGWIGKVGTYGMEGWVRVDGGPNRFDWFRESELEIPKAAGPCLCNMADDVCPYRGPTGKPQCEDWIDG